MRIPLLLATALSLFACKEETGIRNIEAFYFPLDSLKEGRVYLYRSVGHPNDPPMFWHYQSKQEGSQCHLFSTGYFPDFSPDQTFREERVGNGMVLREFFAFEKDPAGNKQKVQGSIEAGNVFPFEVKQPPGVLLTSIRYQQLTDSSTITLVRNRQFDRDTGIIFQGQKRAALLFNLRELADHDKEGHLELEYPGLEIYAEGIGLYFFSKDINEEYQMRYQLAEVYSMRDFDQKYGVKLGQ